VSCIIELVFAPCSRRFSKQGHFSKQGRGRPLRPFSHHRSDPSAFAQGSAGGVIGYDDKSLSGSRPEPLSVEPDLSTHHGKPQDSEPRRTTSRSGGGGSFDGAWVVVSVGCGGSTTGAVVVSSGRIIGGV
jgi:hypothetical protein